MKEDTVILLAEDNDGHAGLIFRHLKSAGLNNPTMHFRNGKEVLAFLRRQGEGPQREDGAAYVLFLDIRMPGIDGIEVLRQVKQDDTLSKIPVIMITTTDDPATVRECHDIGCIRYIIKPIRHEEFLETFNRLGQFLVAMDVPVL